MKKATHKKCYGYCGLVKTIEKFYIYTPSDVFRHLKCIDCISELYKKNKYSLECENCGGPANLDSNKICKKCNKTNGLYECRGCKMLLPLEFAFDGKHRQCKWCMKQKRKHRELKEKDRPDNLKS